jgi:hypothetical protein
MLAWEIRVLSCTGRTIPSRVQWVGPVVGGASESVLFAGEDPEEDRKHGVSCVSVIAFGLYGGRD